MHICNISTLPPALLLCISATFQHLHRHCCYAYLQHFSTYTGTAVMHICNISTLPPALLLCISATFQHFHRHCCYAYPQHFSTSTGTAVMHICNISALPPALLLCISARNESSFCHSVGLRHGGSQLNNFACCFVWVCNFVAHTDGGT
jgi:hypothetical protein